MKNKRGQFYIVAAIIIIVAIAGIASMQTYASAKSKPRTIDSLNSELKEEGLNLIDYGIYNKEDITKLLNNFTDYYYAPYFLKKTDNANIIFVYGNRTDLFSAQYKTESTGQVSATIGTGAMGWNMENTFVNRTKVSVIGDEVNVKMFNKDFLFDIKENEMFYFIIAQEKEGERYVQKS